MKKKTLFKSIVLITILIFGVVSYFAINQKKGNKQSKVESIKQINFENIPDNQEIPIPDQELKSRIKSLLKASLPSDYIHGSEPIEGANDDVITFGEMKRIKKLYLNYNYINITNYSGLEYAINLDYLDIKINKLEDVQIINQLTKVREMQVSINKDVLANIIDSMSLDLLTALKINDSEESDDKIELSKLNKFAKLKELEVFANNITWDETINLPDLEKLILEQKINNSYSHNENMLYASFYLNFNNDDKEFNKIKIINMDKLKGISNSTKLKK